MGYHSSWARPVLHCWWRIQNFFQQTAFPLRVFCNRSPCGPPPDLDFIDLGDTPIDVGGCPTNRRPAAGLDATGADGAAAVSMQQARHSCSCSSSLERQTPRRRRSRRRRCRCRYISAATLWRSRLLFSYKLLYNVTSFHWTKAQDQFSNPPSNYSMFWYRLIINLYIYHSNGAYY